MSIHKVSKLKFEKKGTLVEDGGICDRNNDNYGGSTLVVNGFLYIVFYMVVVVDMDNNFVVVFCAFLESFHTLHM